MLPQELKILQWISLLGWIIVNSVYAQDDQNYQYLKSLEIEELVNVEVVSSATGSKQPISKAPAIVTVITAEEIEAMGATDLDEVLESVPGLHVARRATAYNPIYIMRGMYSDFNAEVALLINNIPLSSLQRGDRGLIWAGMPVHAIQRVEVIRGSGAAVYGADAMAGVINVITKNQEDIQGTQVGIRLGSFNTQEGWILHGDHYGGFDVAATFEYQKTAGQQKIIQADRQTAFDRQFKTHASFAPGPVNLQRQGYDMRLDIGRDHWHWRAGLQQRDDVGTGVGGAFALDPTGRYASSRFNSDLTYHHPQLGEHWDITAQASYLESQWEVTDFLKVLPPGAFAGKFPEGELAKTSMAERHLRVNLSGYYTYFTDHVIRFEFGATNAEVYDAHTLRNYQAADNRPFGKIIDLSETPDNFLPQKTRQIKHLFLQESWQFLPQWELTTGIRHYDYSDFGKTTNIRLGLVGEIRPHLVTKFLYGRAFHPPSFSELYTNSAVSLGNPTLEPETIETTEIAINYSITDLLHLGAEVFSYQTKDSMVLLPIAQGKKQFQNAGGSKGHGLGLELQWKVNDQLNLSSHYSFQTAVDNHQHAIPYTPRRKWYFHADWQFLPHWRANLQTIWIADRYRAYNDPRPQLADDKMVNFTLHYQIHPSWTIRCAVRNLFNADLREPADLSVPNDLPLAGRNYFVEVQYQL